MTLQQFVEHVSRDNSAQSQVLKKKCQKRAFDTVIVAVSEARSIASSKEQKQIITTAAKNLKLSFREAKKIGKRNISRREWYPRDRAGHSGDAAGRANHTKSQIMN